ncbi:MAG: AzlD domain-containing protein [Acetivibrionales bacterium]|jgi:branched-subunit amino acid transport protein
MKYEYTAIALMALVTYIIRVTPVTVFRKEINSIYIKSFLRYIPYVVLGALTFPDIFHSTGNYITALAGAGVALLLAYKEKSLVVVALGSITAAFLTGLLLSA